MAENNETSRTALVGYVLAHAILRSLIAQKVISADVAREIVDHALLAVENGLGVAAQNEPTLQRARADLEETLAQLARFQD